MARRHTLITAIVATGILSVVTVVTAVTEHGTDRLHMTLLTGSFLAGVTTLALAGAAWADSRIREVSVDLNSAIYEIADELHEAVEIQGKTLRDDRIAAVHTLATRLKQGGDGEIA